MRTTIALLCAAAGCSADVARQLSGALGGLGEGCVATVACCGASKLGPSSMLSGSPSSKAVEVLEGATTLALVRGADVAETAFAVASSEVVLLELRQSDLEADGPHGMAQLAPVLQRSLALCATPATTPAKKLLMLVVRQDDVAVPEKELLALASASLARVWAGLRKPAGCETLALGDAFKTTLTLVPAGEDADEAVAQLQARFRDESSPNYLFKQGAWSASGSSALAAIEAVRVAGPAPAATAASANDAQIAYRTSQLAERASKSFTKGLSALRKASESTLLPDFGERMASLIDEAMAKFEADAESLAASQITCVAHAALSAQLGRAAASTCRRQLALLQLSTRDKFMQKLQVRPHLGMEAWSPYPSGRLAFTRYCLTSKLSCGSQSSFYCLSHLQSLHYRITIALRNIRPPHRPLPFMPYTIPYW